MQSALARVTEVLHEDRHGVAETASGVAVSFHELSVEGGLTCLAVGDEVSLVIDDVFDAGMAQAHDVHRTGRRCD